MRTIVTLNDKLMCVERELRMRQRTYERLVRGGRMSADTATREIAMMSEIVNDYREKVHGREDAGTARTTGAGAEGAQVREGAGGAEGRSEDGDYSSDASGNAKAATQAG
jgi:hypothetical protein